MSLGKLMCYFFIMWEWYLASKNMGEQISLKKLMVELTWEGEKGIMSRCNNSGSQSLTLRL